MTAQTMAMPVKAHIAPSLISVNNHENLDAIELSSSKFEFIISNSTRSERRVVLLSGLRAMTPLI